MSPPTWRRALVLGGIRSGKSEFAEALVSSSAESRWPSPAAPAVTYVATARPEPGDPAWTARIDAHRDRRPAGWITAEVGDEPSALLDLLTGADPDATLLVDDVGGWVAPQVTDVTTFDPIAAGLADAVRKCAARLVLVSPEVGLSVVPGTAIGLAFADALGRTNRSIATECDAVVLVVAGNAVPVKGAL
jgi:adenosyl cobinamide kinase/adenosyl cobinamide phosphate guanylyltransferase